jgi:hypothetical protein
MIAFGDVQPRSATQTEVMSSWHNWRGRSTRKTGLLAALRGPPPLDQLPCAHHRRTRVRLAGRPRRRRLVADSQYTRYGLEGEARGTRGNAPEHAALCARDSAVARTKATISVVVAPRRGAGSRRISVTRESWCGCTVAEHVLDCALRQGVIETLPAHPLTVLPRQGSYRPGRCVRSARGASRPLDAQLPGSNDSSSRSRRANPWCDLVRWLCWFRAS